jgi:cytochrome b561
MTRVMPSTSAYGATAKAFHWTIVVLVAVQFVIAFTMPDIGPGVVPDGLIDLHLSFGALILLVVLLRLVWRLAHPVPLTTQHLPLWQATVAVWTHRMFYVVLTLSPLLGWASASVRSWDVSLFGIVKLPALLPPKTRIGYLAGDIHTALSWFLLALVSVHVGAALYHHFVLRDGVLQRMLPGRSR